MLGGRAGDVVTIPDGDLETALRQDLSAAVGGVEPGNDALERIRARARRRSPQPWLLSVLSGVFDRARYWVWRGHWAWPESLPQPRAVAWPGARWATRDKWTAANWLRPVAVLAGVAFIATITLAIPPLRQAIEQVSSNLTGGQSSGGPGTDGSGTPAGNGGGGALTNGARSTAGTGPSSTRSAVSPGATATSQCLSATAAAGTDEPNAKIVAAVSAALSATPVTNCPTPTASASASPSPTGTGTGTATATPTPTSTATATPTVTPTDTPTLTITPTSPSPTGTGTGTPTATPSDGTTGVGT